MSTIGPMRARGTAAGAGGRGASYVYLAGSPRRARKRRRAVVLLVASLVVMVPIGLQIDRATAGSITAGNSTAGQQGTAPMINDGDPAQPPPEPGAIDPSLSRAFGKARTAAQAAGRDLQVTSGFRGVATQQRLYDQAVVKYGTTQRARRWVLPPAESAHVNGQAIDVGPRAAAAWLEKHGVRYGLCRRYVNEWWHFERLAPAIGQQCPALEPFAGG